MIHHELSLCAGIRPAQSAPGGALEKLVWRLGIKESTRVEDVLSLVEGVCEEEPLSRASDR